MARVILVLCFNSLTRRCASTGVVYTPKPFPMPGERRGPWRVPARNGGRTRCTRCTRCTRGSEDGIRTLWHRVVVAEAHLTEPAASIPTASTAADSCAKSTSRTACRCRARYANNFASARKNVDRQRLEPGDLVFFSTVAHGASHCRIVIGGDQFIHAPSEPASSAWKISVRSTGQPVTSAPSASVSGECR